MQHTLTGSLFFSLLVSATVFADGQHGRDMNHDALRHMDQSAMKAMQHGDGQAMQLTDGVAKKVDLKNGKVTLQHGEIANVKMPAMTMSYRVQQAQQLESIQAGDKVRFAVNKLNNDYVVTHIEVVK